MTDKETYEYCQDLLKTGTESAKNWAEKEIAELENRRYTYTKWKIDPETYNNILRILNYRD